MSFDPSRRGFIGLAGAWGAAGMLPRFAMGESENDPALGVSADDLPVLKGALTLYLGRGEGGLYEKVIKAIEKRNPKFALKIRRGPTAALANTIVAEARAGVLRADVFWAVDSGAIGLVANTGKARALPESITSQVDPRFRKKSWVPITGRVRTVPFHTGRLSAEDVPTDVMDIAKGKHKIGWAPAYGAFQSFITAMRLTEGKDATRAWLRDVKKRAKDFAGELGVAMAVSRGEVDIGFANHYYTLRLKKGDPQAKIDLAFTRGDAGCLLNASGAMALRGGDLATNFISYLLSREVQSYLAEEAYEIPMITGGKTPKGLPPLEDIHPPEVDLSKLADMRPTLDLMREARVL